MRKFRIIPIAIFSLVSVFGLKSCTDDILQEETRGVFTPEFFTTELGVQGGLTYLYQNMRNVFGFAYYLNLTETGTDESTVIIKSSPSDDKYKSECP